MKVREFVSLLQKVDQDADLGFTLGRDLDYRKTCASLCLSKNEEDGDGVLQFLEPKQIKSTISCIAGSEVKVVLGQIFFSNEYFVEKLEDYKQGKEI